ncbi:MAG TPA: hypothetical protein VFK40_02785 [Nitrososphaeraceae archaeon]|nr:hypothetical protein [Nitrososphaeraceae archaeon]
MKETLVVCAFFILSVGILTNALISPSIFTQTDGSNQNSSNSNTDGTIEKNNSETKDSQLPESGQISKRGN